MPDSTCSCCKALWIKFYLTADLSRTDPTGTAKIYVEDGIKHFWQGEDPDPDNAGFTVYNLEEVWGADPLTYRFEGKELEVGLACLDESDPSEDRYRIVTLGDAASELVAFTLTQKLECGGSASAITFPLDGTAAKIIRVFDKYGTRSADISYFGWAVKTTFTESGQTLYYIVEIDHRAIGIEVTLTEKVTSSKWETSLIRYFNGNVPVAPGEQLFVYDEDNYFPYKQVGSKGKAIYDPCARKYRLYACQQMSRLLSMTARYAFCDTASPEPENDSIHALEFSPFNLLPDPLPTQSDIINYLSLAGMPGDKVILARDESLQLWVVVQVKHHEVAPIMNIRYSSCKIQAQRRGMWVMLCEEAGDEWEDVISLYEQEFLYDAALDSSSSAGSGGSGSEFTCDFKVRKARVCGFEEPRPNEGWETALQFKGIQVVIDVDADSDRLFGEFRTVFVACATLPQEFLIAEIDECESSSGSSSGS